MRSSSLAAAAAADANASNLHIYTNTTFSVVPATTAAAAAY